MSSSRIRLGLAQQAQNFVAFRFPAPNTAKPIPTMNPRTRQDEAIPAIAAVDRPILLGGRAGEIVPVEEGVGLASCVTLGKVDVVGEDDAVGEDVALGASTHDMVSLIVPGR